MANRGIAQRTLGDVSYSGSGGVGDCPRLISTLGDPRETSGPRIDRIPLTRPSWWRRQLATQEIYCFWHPVRGPLVSLDHERTERYSKSCSRSSLLASVLHRYDRSSPTSRANAVRLGIAAHGALLAESRPGAVLCGLHATTTRRNGGFLRSRAAQPLQAHSKKNAASR